MIDCFGRDLRPKHLLQALPFTEQLGVDVAGGLMGIFGAGLQNDWARDNMRLAKDLNKELQEHSADLEQRNWQTQFDKTNAYNLPSNQVGRLLAAGVNPFIDTSTAAPVAGSATSPAPSGVGVAGVSPLPAPEVNLAGSIRTLVSAAKDAKELPFVQEQIQAHIKNLLAQAANEQEKTEINRIAKEIQQEFGKQTAEKSLKLLNERINEVRSIIDKNDMEGLRAFSESLLNDAKRALTAKEYDAFDAKFQKLLELWQSEITQNRASAVHHTASADYEHWQAEGQKIKNGIDALIYKRDKETFDDVVSKIKNESSISEANVAVARAAAARAAIEEDYAVQMFWKDFLTDCLSSGIDVLELWANFKNAGSYARLSKAQKAKVDQDIAQFEREILEKKYGKKVVHRQRTPNGDFTETYYENK